MRLNLSPYFAAYGVIVFLLPWAIYGGYVLRANYYMENHSILREHFADSKLRERILQQHPQLDHFYRKSIQWRTRVFRIWAVGFVVLAGASFLLSRWSII